jgi:hypothetical protein
VPHRLPLSWTVTLAGCLSLVLLAGCCHSLGRPCCGCRNGGQNGNDDPTAGRETVYQNLPRFFPVPTRPVFSSRTCDARDDVGTGWLPEAAAPARPRGPVRLPATRSTPEEVPMPLPQPPPPPGEESAGPAAPTPIRPDAGTWLFAPRVSSDELKKMDRSVELKYDGAAKVGAKP